MERGTSKSCIFKEVFSRKCVSLERRHSQIYLVDTVDLIALQDSH